MTPPRTIAQRLSTHSCHVRKTVAELELVLDQDAALRLLDAVEDLGQTEDSADDDDEIDAAKERGIPKVKRGMPLTPSMPIVEIKTPGEGGEDDLEGRPAAEDREQAEGHHRRDRSIPPDRNGARAWPAPGQRT